MATNRVYYSKEAEDMARRDRIIRSLTFMLLGLGVGAAIAVLFAPDEGDKTREMITDALEEGFSRGRKATTDALKQLEHEYPNLRERVDGVIDNVRN